MRPDLGDRHVGVRIGGRRRRAAAAAIVVVVVGRGPWWWSPPSTWSTRTTERRVVVGAVARATSRPAVAPPRSRWRARCRRRRSPAGASPRDRAAAPVAPALTEPELREHLLDVRVDRRLRLDLGDRPIRVLQPVAGNRAHHNLVALDQTLSGRLEEAGHRRRRGGLDEHALQRGQQPVGVEDLGVGDRADVRRPTRRGPRSRRPSSPDCRCGSRWRSSPGAAPARRCTSGADPAACQPSIRGDFVTRPSRAYSQ